MNHIPMVVCPNPFTLEGRQAKTFSYGMSIRELICSFDLDPDTVPMRVCLDDRYIDQAHWHRVRPKPGHLVSVRVIPGQGGGSKDILRIVAMVGVLALAFAAPSLAPVGWGLVGAWTGAALTATVGIAGALALNALIPPANPNIPQMGGAQGADRSPSFSISGTRNEMNLYGPVPRVFGRMRFFPPYGAEPYTEIVGNDQYLRVVFCLGYGPLELSDFKIGDTPISQFDDVEMEVRQGFSTDLPLTLYTGDVHEDGLSLPLGKDIGWQQRRSIPDVDELSVDITFPQGLYRVTENGDTNSIAAYIRIEYTPVGEENWQLAGPLGFFEGANYSVPTNPKNFEGFEFRAETIGNTKLLRRGLRWKPAQGRGQYDVRVRRNPLDTNYLLTELLARLGTNPIEQSLRSGNTIFNLFRNDEYLRSLSHEALMGYIHERAGLLDEIQWQQKEQAAIEATPANRIVDDGFWTCLRSIKYQEPIRLANMCKVALRIRTTDQLNNVIDAFNCIAHSILPTWNGFSWVPVATSNPASAYRYLYQGPATNMALGDSRLHLTQLEDWSQANADNGREIGVIIDYQTTLQEAARLVAATGRATIQNQDGKYTVVRDVPQADPVQIFTPRNSWGFRGSKTFFDIPHGLKINFKNEEKNWTTDEIIVYVDGYNADGSNGLIAASKFDTMDISAVTKPSLIYKDGRYHLAQAILRPETYELNTDMEHLSCTRGDLVGVVSDVALWGLGSGRVLAVALDGSGNTEGVTLDNPIEMSLDFRYAIRYRREDGRQIEQEIVAQDGAATVIEFTEVIAEADAPAIGDLFGFGEVDQVYTRHIVKMIQHKQDIEAMLTLLDEAPAIHTADTGPIPPFNPQITIPLPLRKPQAPIIDEIISDERALIRDPDGSYRSRIIIRMHFVSGLTPAARVEVRYRLSASTESWSQASATVDGDADQLEISPVKDLYYYDMVIRAVSKYNVPSDWVTLTKYHVVSRALPPPSIRGLSLEGNRLSWAYPNQPEDWLGFAVRMQIGNRTVWSDAVSLHDGFVSESHFQVPEDSGERTYLVKAIDSSWNESDVAVSLFVDWGARLVANVVESIDYAAMGFPGLITNGAIVTGSLEADADSPAWGPDNSPAWRAPSVDPWASSYKEMTYTFYYTPPSDLVDGSLYFDFAIEGIIKLEFRTQPATPYWGEADDPAWGADTDPAWPAIGEWVAWPGQLSTLSHQRYEFRVTLAAGNVQGIIDGIDIILDMPDVQEELDNVAIGSSGTRLALTKVYSVIKVVAPKLLDDGGDAAYIRITDKDITGPLLKAYDSNNVLTTAHIDVTVQGY